MSNNETPEFDPCPLCGLPVNPYRLADTGMVRCWPCGLRLEKKGGLKAAAKVWNKRVRSKGHKEVPVTISESVVTVPEFTVQSLVPEPLTTLEAFISAQLGGPWYVSSRAIAKQDKAGQKRIKPADYERYEKLFNMRKTNG